MSSPSPGSRPSGVPGFEILTDTELTEFQARGLYIRHVNTGCEIYHVLNGDADNLFSFTFRTPPRDNTGVAHILEHSVLCGSRNFPAKDPFLLLLKGSMNTYMNAFTYPDKTVYPASSQVEQDFYNLFRVYGDAVFFPLLRRESFMQEGHRREISGDGTLEAVGIVYNEMKGNYSSHDSIAGEWAYRSLFPGSPYEFDSGGEPRAVLDLTWEDFTAFHGAFYNPSNCRIFLYGNIPTEKHLRFLEENFLSRFERKPVLSDVPFVGRWAKPGFLERSYPAGEGESEAKSSSVTVNWLLFPVTDPLKVLSFEVLAEILLGNAGSPLQKALVDSGLGEDLSPATGIETETLELTFSAGLRGTSPRRRRAIEKLIFSVIRGLSEQGLDPEHVEGALRRVEFRNREIRAGSAFGMRLMRRALRGWLHGEAPERTMAFRGYIDELKRLLARDGRYFEKLLDEYLLANPHRTTLVVKPDPELAARQDAETRLRLDTEAAALGEEGWDALRGSLENFKAFQERPDTPGDLASIPSLDLSAIPPGLDIIPTETVRVAGTAEAWAHDIYTNGIVYADFAFELDDGREPDMYLPLYTAALTGIGAGEDSYDRVALDLSLKTGGFSTQIEAGTVAGGGGRVRQFLFLRLKSLEKTFPEALGLLGRILLDPDFADTKRLRDIFLEYRNEIKSSIIPGGHAYAASRAERGLSRAEEIEEKWKGISQYRFVAGLPVGKAAARMAERFDRIRRTCLTRKNLIVNFTSPADAWPRIAAEIEAFAAALPGTAASAPDAEAPSVPARGRKAAGVIYPRIEGIAVPSTVGFVATAVPSALLGRKEHAHEAVLAHLLSTGYLWEKIRMKGGAYGAFSSALGREGIMSFASYRDPNILSTLNAFREAVAGIAREGVDAESAKNAVIGTAAKEMKPLSPGGKSIVGFKRKLYGIPDELRLTHQRDVLGTRVEDLKSAAERLLAAFDHGYSAVVAGKPALDEAGRDLPGLAENITEVSL